MAIITRAPPPVTDITQNHVPSQTCICLEHLNNSTAQQIQGIPKDSPDVCVASLGWILVMLTMEIARILILWRTPKKFMYLRNS